MLDMVADLCRLYHFSVDHVLSMPMNRASFLWGRGIASERMQAARIAGFVNGVNIDAEIASKEKRRREFRDGRPSDEGAAIIKAMMENAENE